MSFLTTRPVRGCRSRPSTRATRMRFRCSTCLYRTVAGGQRSLGAAQALLQEPAFLLQAVPLVDLLHGGASGEHPFLLPIRRDVARRLDGKLRLEGGDLLPEGGRLGGLGLPVLGSDV